MCGGGAEFCRSRSGCSDALLTMPQKRMIFEMSRMRCCFGSSEVLFAALRSSTRCMSCYMLCSSSHGEGESGHSLNSRHRLLAALRVQD